MHKMRIISENCIAFSTILMRPSIEWKLVGDGDDADTWWMKHIVQNGIYMSVNDQFALHTHKHAHPHTFIF